MTRSTHATLLIILFLSGSAIQTQGFSYYRRCIGVHAEYRTCGSACPTTCEDLLNPSQRRTCTQQCVASCFCQTGYVRMSYQVDSPCIKIEECYAKRIYPNCRNNEVYTRCGSACPSTCKDLVYPQTSRVCTSQCVAGFFCKEGYYRTDDGRCVQRPECCESKTTCSNVYHKTYSY
ncbi:unnamed protein product [Rotaria sp. Silwood2]|nr:unnamed protein product [Rotaria sp. Silwood2]CAF3110365.1 unnamed protein product [Rotaria sp. Silwood2]CAF3126048.1 unnamed protein product [Rotaria sp. Silwood2]CAF4184843.1 unnamed protein product [Rotaria sp. Silwood2]CAF4464512.1 unnamed protein product [Rotaria sp. Silwood2]